MMLRVNLNLRCASILIFSYLKIYLRLTSPFHKIDLLSCHFSWRVYAFFGPNPSSLCTCIDDRRTRAVSSQQEKIIFLGKLDWLVGLVWKTVYRNGLWWDENRGNWVKFRLLQLCINISSLLFYCKYYFCEEVTL